MRGDWYQLSLIFLALVVTVLFGGFLYRELFPEYKKYQNAYVALEEFRSSYTGQPPPPFEKGIKQIVLESKKSGPPVIDRCTSCHVAVQFSHFSPTRAASDINGNPIYNDAGLPVQEPNPDYIWEKLDQKIAQLKSNGHEREAKKLQSLKTVEVGDHIYDMTKVLSAHPLMGRETRPFEYHPIDEYGCTVCHNGNGRGLTTEKAHGPVYDGQYEAEYMGPTPEFTEKDPLNDPDFARVFNHKPGHKLLFQTTPIYVGALIQANCVQCHSSSASALADASREASLVAKRREEKSDAIKEAYLNEKNALLTLLGLTHQLQKEGWTQTIEQLTQNEADYSTSDEEALALRSQLDFLLRQETQDKAMAAIADRVEEMVGGGQFAKKLMDMGTEKIDKQKIEEFVNQQVKLSANQGTLLQKRRALEKDQRLMTLAESAKSMISETAKDENVQEVLASEIDQLTENFHRGKELYISQACYACHRIDGLARGGIGPELTNIGEFYPWYIKESMVWPQANLKTSTMPNFRMDHEELEDLTAFLLAQKGRRPATSEAAYKTQLLEWETGYQLPWERPINPGEQFDLRYSMTVFATQGCAACHRLKGFESNVGFAVEKVEKPPFKTLFKERQWFKKLIPEEISGSELVSILEEHGEEIDHRIVDHVREDSLLEELEINHPGIIESYHTNFKFASRAKNHHYKELIGQSKNPIEQIQYKAEWKKWKERVNRVLMIYIQEYGLGRIIGPRPNWSGIYRSDEWLMEHFKKPSQLVARSIMPVLPFDDSKFYALTYMLDQLAVRNRNEVRQIWDTFGFDPQLAFSIHCSQCHGDHKRGNGPVSEWIYPIPKNLTNAEFLRNLTRLNAFNSIKRGVAGSPMPPWGEVAAGKNLGDEIPVLTENEIEQLVDWLYAPLAGENIMQEVERVDKWKYGPEDILEELEKEQDSIDPGPPPENIDLRKQDPSLGKFTIDSGERYLASLTPTAAGVEGDRLSRIGAVFDVYPNPDNHGEKYLYYIKQRYYTQQNLQKGEEFFVLNCASCHGKDADGQGYRAGTMFDAKPRMLTNFPWISTRDDLRLLRSIKYGVAGTAMTPWGDQTSSLQRLQLVMYIRSLSKEQEMRDQLTETIYQTFEQQDLIVQKARAALYEKLNQYSKELDSLKVDVLLENLSEKEMMNAYQQEIVLNQQIKSRKMVDSILLEIKADIEKEKQIYQNIGNQLIGKPLVGGIFDQYLDLVKLNPVAYQFTGGRLYQSYDKQKESEIEGAGWKVFQHIQENVQVVEMETDVEEGKLPSKERSERIEDLKGKIYSYKMMQKALASGLEEAKRLRKKQVELYANYQNKVEAKR